MNSSSSGRNVKHIDVKAQCHPQIEDVAISCGEGSCSPINYQCGNFGGAGIVQQSTIMRVHCKLKMFGKFMSHSCSFVIQRCKESFSIGKLKFLSTIIQNPSLTKGKMPFLHLQFHTIIYFITIF